MNKKIIYIILGVFGAISLASFISLGTLIYLNNFRPVPKYSFTQEPSTQDSNFFKSYLTLDDKVYVHDYSEENLENLSFGPTIRIGSTDFEIIYPIKGNNPSDYIFLRGFMDTGSIFRNANITPHDIKSIDVNEIQLRRNEGFFPKFKTTQNKVVINEVLTALRDPKFAQNISENNEVYHIDLMTDKMKNIGIYFYVVIDKNKNVYLAENSNPDKWIIVGENFTKWLKGQ